MLGAESDESSPIFVQFLDCVWQLLKYAPDSFEFSELYLSAIFSGVATRRHGTFLCNSARERREHQMEMVRLSPHSARCVSKSICA